MNFIEINPNTFTGVIPKGYDLIIVEHDDRLFEGAITLYGFDEVGIYDSMFNNPIYGFLKLW